MMLVAFCLQKRVDIAMILPIMVNVLISVLTNWKRGERMEDNTRISSLLKMIDIRIRQDLDARNQDLHISSSQMRTLSYLISNADHEINPRDLEQYFRISKPTVAGILKRLEEKGYGFGAEGDWKVAFFIMKKVPRICATSRSFWMSRHISALRSCGRTSPRWNPGFMRGFLWMS